MALADSVSFPCGVGAGLGVGVGIGVGVETGVGLGVATGVAVGVGVGGGPPANRTVTAFEGLESKTPPDFTVFTTYV